jgi:hypothetical protein
MTGPTGPDGVGMTGPTGPGGSFTLASETIGTMLVTGPSGLAYSSVLQITANNGGTGTAQVAGDLLPAADNIYSLGSTSQIWKDLWVGTGSVHIGPTGILSANDNGNVTVNSGLVSYNSSIIQNSINSNTRVIFQTNETNSQLQLQASDGTNSGSLNFTNNNGGIISCTVQINNNEPIGAFATIINPSGVGGIAGQCIFYKDMEIQANLTTTGTGTIGGVTLSDSNVSATSGTIGDVTLSGNNVSATSGTIGGVTLSGSNVSATSGTIGDVTLSGNNVSATSGTIGGVTLNNGGISGNIYTTTITQGNEEGTIAYTVTSPGFYIASVFANNERFGSCLIYAIYDNTVPAYRVFNIADSHDGNNNCFLYPKFNTDYIQLDTYNAAGTDTYNISVCKLGSCIPGPP